MPFNIGPGELVLVLIIALIVVGPGKLPDVGAAIGKSLREFRKAAADVQDAVATQPPAAPVVPAPAIAPVAIPPAAPVPAAPAAATAAQAQDAGAAGASAPSGPAGSSAS